MTLEQRTEARRAAFLKVAQEQLFWISADMRVKESAAAFLLGYKPATLATKRQDGTGPSWFPIGGDGFRVSYDLGELAAWVENQRVNPG